VRARALWHSPPHPTKPLAYTNILLLVTTTTTTTHNIDTTSTYVYDALASVSPWNGILDGCHCGAAAPYSGRSMALGVYVPCVVLTPSNGT
jgi:hypothetical protein